MQNSIGKHLSHASLCQSTCRAIYITISAKLIPWLLRYDKIFVSYNTVYAIYFAHRYFCDFGLSGEIRESLISRFSDVFITINRQILKWKCLRGLIREIHENKTTAYSKPTTYKYKQNIWTCFGSIF